MRARVYMYVHTCAHVHIAKAGRWYAHAYSIEGGLHTRHAESADASRGGGYGSGPRSGGRIILVISDASRDKAIKADAANAVTNGPYWAGVGPDGNTVFRMRVRIGITCARDVRAARCADIAPIRATVMVRVFGVRWRNEVICERCNKGREWEGRSGRGRGLYAGARRD